ncbi:N(G),N(G)-dimethylarginine dimethylaminohydrolase 1-like [Branchiostoma floridae x Branchiostoma japonicum]
MDNIFNFPEFKRAVVREIPNTINSGLRDESSTQKINVEKCRKEWENYVQVLKDLGLEVTVIPADDSCPDCPFVEDCCVVIGDTALITRPKYESRRRETPVIAETMQNLGLKVHVVESDTATLEGGDVMFTGKEIFCGDSMRSNTEGFQVLQETFPDFPCHQIKIRPPEPHLLGTCGYAAPGVIAVFDGDDGMFTWDYISEVAHQKYKPLWLPDHFANNCMYVNGTILHCTKETKPESYEIFQEEMADYDLIAVSTKEVGKADAALTCQSLLF